MGDYPGLAWWAQLIVGFHKETGMVGGGEEECDAKAEGEGSVTWDPGQGTGGSQTLARAGNSLPESLRVGRRLASCLNWVQ